MTCRRKSSYLKRAFVVGRGCQKIKGLVFEGGNQEGGNSIYDGGPQEGGNSIYDGGSQTAGYQPIKHIVSATSLSGLSS